MSDGDKHNNEWSNEDSYERDSTDGVITEDDGDRASSDNSLSNNKDSHPDNTY